MKKKNKQQIIVATNFAELSKEAASSLAKKIGVFLAIQKQKELDLAI